MTGAAQPSVSNNLPTSVDTCLLGGRNKMNNNFNTQLNHADTLDGISMEKVRPSNVFSFFDMGLTILEQIAAELETMQNMLDVEKNDWAKLERLLKEYLNPIKFEGKKYRLKDTVLKEMSNLITRNK